MVDAVSKLVHSKHQPARQGDSRVNIPASPQPRGSMNTPGMRLRGRDLQGRSYDIAFSESDFQMSGGKLAQNIGHGDADAANAGTPAHLAGVDGDAC